MAMLSETRTHSWPDDAVEFDPDTYLPDRFDSAPTRSDPVGLWVLTVRGQCRCGNREWRLARSRVPQHSTQDCLDCLGTMQLSKHWARVDRIVDEYVDLKPADEQRREERGGTSWCSVCGGLVHGGMDVHPACERQANLSDFAD